MARNYKQMMHQVMNNMCQTNEEVLCCVFGTVYREKLFGVFGNKPAEMFAGITSAGNLLIYYHENFGTSQVSEVYPLSCATKLKIGEPNFLGVNKIKINFNINGKKKSVEMMVVSDVDNSDLDEQPRNLDRMIRELRRKTKLY
ncbi:MAG: hypothetical protein IJ397_02285 [Lachnospiraceae bacterium]|nr:hypothetical protein [Lachnospiraceae bacterium]